MRKYRAVLPETIARIKARQEEAKKRKVKKEAEHKREVAKRKREREKELEKKRKKREKQKQKEREARLIEKAKLREKKKKEAKKRRKIAERERYKKYHEENKERIEENKRLRIIRLKEAKLVSLAKRAYEKSLQQIEKEKQEKEEQKKIIAAEKRKARNQRYHKKIMRKKRISESNRRYYDTHLRLKLLQKHIDENDIPGHFIVAIAQDGVIGRIYKRSEWWNAAIAKYNELVSKNHETVMCPAEEITSSSKPTMRTIREIVLVKKINPEVEDNISVFRDEFGKTVTVRTNKENWTIVLKEPWYVEEKFIVPNQNPRSSKKTAGWICENFIENDLSIDNMKKVFLWQNYVIIDGDKGFEFAIGRTVRAAINLYITLFKKYENTEYVYFIGELHHSLVRKWGEKIREKTGWENLQRAKRTYLTKASSSEEEMLKSIPTSSKSTRSTGSRKSGRS